MASCDYVIVGAGSAGAPLARRLADGGAQVILLEAGGRARHPWVNIPIGYGKVFYDARFNWKYTTGPEPELNGNRMYWPRGKGLGGSSAINAMVYVRGHPGDFDEWNAVAPGWGWEDVAPVFHRMEDWRGPAHHTRGKGGPLCVSDMSGAMHTLTRAYIKGAEQTGIPYNPDYNADSMEGSAFYQITTDGGLRASTSRAYLKGAPETLRLETGALATRVIFDGRRAVGVEYRQNGTTKQATARREVILCGGAINTPQLLQLSGIGPGALLQKMGIGVVRDMPHVGRNLMDHLSVDFLFSASQPSLNQRLRPWWGKALAGAQYILTRKGPLAMSLNQGGGFVRLDKGNGPPDLQLYFSPLSYSRAPVGTRPLMNPDPFPAYRLGFNPCKPTSCGYVEIKSPDPADAPAMQGNYLATEEDRAMMIRGFRLIRQMATAPALQEIAREELEPGLSVESDEDVLAHIRGDSWTVFHQCGTARMGADASSAVVDARLRVHGVDGLRAADASVFPTIPSGNTNAPAIMVGEKASDIIREDAR